MKNFLLLLSITFCFKAWGQNCLENRAAINMGASTMRLVVATVDICKIEISKFLIEKEIIMDFTGPVKNSGGVISLALQIEAIAKLNKYVTSAKAFFPRGIVLIPSKFFKSCKNYMTFFKKIKEDLKVNVFLPNLETEAILGFLGVKIKFPNTSKLLVWDMGSFGTNWTLLKENLDFKVYFEKMNPNIFKNMVIEGVLKKNHKKVSSPNPLGSKNAKKALELIRTYATFNIPLDLKKKAKDFKVIGIGGFHNHSIMKQIGQKGESYTFEKLERTLQKMENLKDKEIGGPFAQHQVTNLILAMGYLSTLKIDQVFTSGINEAHGALMYPKFWKNLSK